MILLGLVRGLPPPPPPPKKKIAHFDWLIYSVVMVKREPCKTHIGHSGHVHTNTDIFETAYIFFYLDSCGWDKP